MQQLLFKQVTRDERQEQCRVTWIKNKCKGTLVQPTGAGKTISALKCLSSVINKYPTLKILVVVPTDNLVQQWRQQLPTWGLEFNTEVKVINSIIKQDWKVDILCLDELHRYAAETFKQVFEKVNYKYILGLTATFERLDGKHELIAKYCPVIDTITQEEALTNGWVSPYKEYLVLINVDDIENYKEYNREFQQHFEYLGYDFGLAMSLIGPKGFINRAKLRDERCPNGTENERKEVFKAITYHATAFIRSIQQRKAFINNHPKKIEIARQIIQARPFAKIITFSNNIKMAESIGIGKVYSGKDTKKKGRITLEEFEKGDFQVINSIAKLNEGADIKGLSVAIILGLDSSETKATQRKGRAIRKEGDKQAEIFNIVIDGTIEVEWFKKSHSNQKYIVLDEKGLADVLVGKEPKPYNRNLKNFQFRF